MANGLLIETTKDWLVVKIPRKLICVRKGVALTVVKALRTFKKGKEEFKAGKLRPVSSLREIL